MSDDIQITEPDWKNTPDECPYCGSDLEQDLKEGRHGVTGWKVQYRNGETDHGECTEVTCLDCNIILQRHYPDEDISQTEDPLVDPEDWVQRAQVLEYKTVLTSREAQVKALKEEEKSHSEIAEVLDISESTVGEYSRRINNRIEESINTVEDLGAELDPLRHVEGQMSRLVVIPSDSWKCGYCDADLSVGDSFQLLTEFVGNQWKTMDLFCKECDVEMEGDLFEEAPDYNVTYALVEGKLDRKGDDHFPTKMNLESEDSLVMSDPEIRRIIN